MQSRGLRPAIGYGEADQNVVRRILGVFNKDVEIAVFVKDAGID